MSRRYVLKRKHIMRTDLLILLFIIVPLVIFWIGVGIEGSTMQELREKGWFLTTTYGSCDGSGSGSAYSTSESTSASLSGCWPTTRWPTAPNQGRRQRA